MPLVQTRGAASAQGFGEFAQASAPVYIEDVFSTYLYTGTGATQTIINNIDLATKGGLTWIKCRNIGYTHFLNDTVRGAGNVLQSNATSANQATTPTFGLTSFNANGFTVKDDGSGPGGALAGQGGGLNGSGNTYVSWTFREQPKFFDVVTYTGNGTSITVPHSLGSAPGCIIVKRTNTTGDWPVYHRSVPSNCGFLNYTNTFSSAQRFSSVTSTDFTINVSTADVNASGSTYVAYIFAHDAGGFGLTGTDNVISCGSYTGVGSTQQDITLGYEPQWLMIKRTDVTSPWVMVDVMRGLYQTADNALTANTAIAEAGDVSMSGAMQPIATGFHLYNANSAVNASGGTYIYIAIRRGPMKVPTLGTSVFQPVTYSGNGSNNRVIDTTITPDLIIDMRRDNVMNKYFLDRLRGNGRLYSDLTNAESSNTAQFPANTFNVNQTGVTVSADEVNASGRTFVLEAFRRAPSFFDEVCWTATGSTQTLNHNLAAVPEIIITKKRIDNTSSGAAGWIVMSSAYTGGFISGGLTSFGQLQSSAAVNIGGGGFLQSIPTSTTFTLLASNYVATNSFVAYLFATCPGVSKVGSYTGNGTTQTIDCGFTGGARFVLIKRTDSTGDWYVYDTARGMTVLTDPYLWLNDTAAEVATLGSVTTVSTGFALNSAIVAAINTNAASYIFLAIA